MATVEDFVIGQQIAEVEEIARLHRWPFEQVGPRCFRVCFDARNGDLYQIEIVCDKFPARPAEFHWRNPKTGHLNELSDSPLPYQFFHDTGKICAPWNRLASAQGGPHPEWAEADWKQQPETKGTVTLAAMVIRIHHELRSKLYRGKRG